MLINRTEKTDKSVSIDLLICLCALVFMSVYYYGYRALTVTAISVVACYATDQICIYLRKQKFDFGDISSIVSGATLALLMPASISYGMLIIVSVTVIIIGKQIFGGIENPIFHPVAVGYALVTLCWKEVFLLFPTPQPLSQLSLSSHILDTQTHSLTYFLNMGNVPPMANLDILLGRFLGPMGTTHIIIMMVCAVCLVFRRSTSFLALLSCFATLAASAVFFPLIENTKVINSIIYEMISGSTLFVMLFIACDFKTSPKTKFGRLLYGVLIAVLALIFRRYANMEQGIIFAVILGNVLASTMDECGVLLRKLLKYMKILLIKFMKLLHKAIIKLAHYLKTQIVNIINKNSNKNKVEQSVQTNSEEKTEMISEENAVEESSISEKATENSQVMFFESAPKKERRKSTRITPKVEIQPETISEAQNEIKSKENVVVESSISEKVSENSQVLFIESAPKMERRKSTRIASNVNIHSETIPEAQAPKTETQKQEILSEPVKKPIGKKKSGNTNKPSNAQKIVEHEEIPDNASEIEITTIETVKDNSLSQGDIPSQTEKYDKKTPVITRQEVTLVLNTNKTSGKKPSTKKSTRNTSSDSKKEAK